MLPKPLLTPPNHPAGQLTMDRDNGSPAGNTGVGASDGAALTDTTSAGNLPVRPIATLPPISQPPASLPPVQIASPTAGLTLPFINVPPVIPFNPTGSGGGGAILDPIDALGTIEAISPDAPPAVFAGIPVPSQDIVLQLDKDGEWVPMTVPTTGRADFDDASIEIDPWRTVPGERLYRRIPHAPVQDVGLLTTHATGTIGKPADDDSAPAASALAFAALFLGALPRPVERARLADEVPWLPK